MPGVSKRVRFTPRTQEDDEPNDSELLSISRKQMRTGPITDTSDDNVTSAPPTSSNGQHTLDSDEEEEQKYGLLNMEDVEGEEETTIDHDGDTKITPFNMRDEMDEGHFDSEGTFIFKKKDEDIHDAWLDNIDWANAKAKAGNQWEKAQFEIDEDSEVPAVNREPIFDEMCKLVRPGETVTRALKRLGGSKSAIAARQHKWQQPGTSSEPENPETDNAKADTEAMLRLTELVDRLVSDGEFEAYGFTHERLKIELDKLKDGNKAVVTEPVDSGLDMFAEGESDAKETPVTSKQTVQNAASESENKNDGSVTWYLKWENSEEAEIHGPFPTTQMESWADEGYFREGGFVKRADKDESDFYSAKRIDFGLYT